MSSAGNETVTTSARPAHKRAMTAGALLRALLLATFGLALVGTQTANAFTVSGTVTAYWTSGRPIARTQITVTECIAGPQVASATSDSAGFYRFGLPAGAYVMNVTPPGYGDYTFPADQPLSVTADQTLNVVLGPHGDGPYYPPATDRISTLRISPPMLAAASEGPSALSAGSCATGAIVTYLGSRAATTTFTVQRRLAGRRSGRNCVKSTRRTKNRARCNRYIKVGSFTHTDAMGTNLFRFTARINGRKLPPGQYRLDAVPRDAVGAGPDVHTSFSVAQ